METLTPKIAPELGVVLTLATASASNFLGLSGAALAFTVGLSEPTVPRILKVKGKKTIDPDSNQGELALLLVRVYQGLVATLNYLDGMRA